MQINNTIGHKQYFCPSNLYFGSTHVCVLFNVMGYLETKNRYQSKKVGINTGRVSIEDPDTGMCVTSCQKSIFTITYMMIICKSLQLIAIVIMVLSSKTQESMRIDR